MKFRVVGDPTNKPRFSSSIIITSLNEAAKKLDLYDENGLIVMYDSCCNKHGYEPDAYISTYEICFPNIILNNANQKPIFGVSKQNLQFIIEGGYPKNLCDYFLLGVDSEKFPKVEKKYNLDKFVIGSNTESLCRGGLNEVIRIVGTNFNSRYDCKDILLRIKDRNGTPRFKQWVEEQVKYYGIEIEYVNEHFNTIDQIIKWHEGIDINLYLNFSSTWAMPPIESISMGVPLVSMSYSGPSEYLVDNFSGLVCQHAYRNVFDDLPELEKIGTRNFFFPKSFYRKEPIWAIPDMDSTASNINLLKNNPDIRKQISNHGRSLIEKLSWEKSAFNLSALLSKFYS